jgi:hypothetical protein
MTPRSSAPFVVLACVVLAGCGPQGAAPPVSFKGQVHPILKNGCGDCHGAGGAGTAKTGFSVESHDSVMKGTKFGAVIAPGSAISSSLYRLVAGEVDPSIRMPHGDKKLPAEDINLIKTWIDQGAKDN